MASERLGLRWSALMEDPNAALFGGQFSQAPIVMVNRTTSGALLVTVSALLNRAVLEPQFLAYLLLVEAYDNFAVYDGGGSGLGVDLDHLLHGVEIGTDILLGKIDVSLRQELYLFVADRSAGCRIDDHVLCGHSPPLFANVSPS